MLNHIVIMGRLTRDPELRYTSQQVPVASFTVAVDRDYGGRDGAEKQTDFFDCSAWRHTAEFVSKYFTKGSMAVVSGRIQFRDWTDREGNKRRNAELVVENIYFGESKRSRDEYQASRGSGGYSSGGQANYGGYNQGGQSGQSNYGGYSSGGQGGYSGGYNQGGYSGGYGSDSGGYGSDPGGFNAAPGGFNAAPADAPADHASGGASSNFDDFSAFSGNDASSSFSDLSETDGELPF